MATTDWLLLRLPPQDDAETSWAVADATGQLLSLPSTDTGGGLHTLSTGRRVALLVSGADVSQFQVALPAGNEARLLQLAPFALEDQVSQDVEALHFAVGKRDATTGLVPVAVVERSHMQEWLQRAAQLQLIPQAVFAESDLAPVLPGHVTMVIADDQLLLRNDAARPLLLPASDPSLALEMLLGAASLDAVHLVVYASPADWQRHGSAVETLRSRVASLKVQLSSGGLLSQFAQGLAHSSPINLMQGGFRQQRAGGASWQQWRWVAMLAGALLLLHGLGSLWQMHQLREASAKSEQEMTRLYGSIFPGQPAGAHPRRTLEKRLASLAGEANQQGELLHLLAAVAAAKQNVPVAKLQSAMFEPGLLKMKLSAPDATTLEQFNQALRASGYTAELISGSVRSGNYEGQIELKSPRMNRSQLAIWYTTLAPRDRRVLQIGGVVALLILLVGIFLPLQTSLAAARQQLLTQQADLEWMRRVGPTLAAAGPGPMNTAEPANLAVLVDQSARESGLALALTGSQLVDKGAMRVQMEQADFNLLTGWIARLSSQHGLKVEAASITSSPTPGVVNASVQLRAR